MRRLDVWVIGDVYTRPDFRGRGYAKIVTSAVTRDAINSGASVMLHVKSNNYPAIKYMRKMDLEF